MKQEEQEIPIREEDAKDADLANGMSLIEERRPEEAVRFLTMSAERGNPSAMFVLGLLFTTGKAGSVHEGIDYLRKAAEKDLPQAQHQLAVICFEGQLSPEDDRMAAYWWGRAAKLGYPDAQLALGNMYSAGNGVPRDPATAFGWYKEAAEQGNSDAQYNTALAYEEGDGVEQSYENAKIWYAKAAENGDRQAARRLKKLKKF